MIKNIFELFKVEQKYFSIRFWLKNIPQLNFCLKNNPSLTEMNRGQKYSQTIRNRAKILRF